MKKFYIPLLLSLNLLLAGTNLFGQYAAVISSNFQLSATFENERIVWDCEVGDIRINTATGIIQAWIPVDEFRLKMGDAAKTTGKETGQGKNIELYCQLPIAQIVDKRNASQTVGAELIIRYNQVETTVPFNFTIVSFNKVGFSINSQGAFEHQALMIEGLSDFDSEVYIIWSIVGR